jgi:hypothetical protein
MIKLMIYLLCIYVTKYITNECVEENGINVECNAGNK